MGDNNLNQTQQGDKLQGLGKNGIETQVQEEVAKNLQATIIKKVQDSLEKQSLGEWNINIEEKPGGFQKISICSKNITKKAEGQIAIAIKPNGTISFHVNPYEHYEEFYYIAENLSPEKYFQYSEGFNQIIDGKLPEDVPTLTSLEKVEYPNYDDYIS